MECLACEFEVIFYNTSLTSCFLCDLEQKTNTAIIIIIKLLNYSDIELRCVLHSLVKDTVMIRSFLQYTELYISELFKI